MASIIGEASAVIATLNFIMWAANITPKWTAWLWIAFAVIFIVDWMMGGVDDKGISQNL